MPDWSYRTLLRPVLLRLGPENARGLAIATLSALGRTAIGRGSIDFLGHMRADPRLALRRGAIATPAPVGLAALIDPNGSAAAAFARFGVGFVEIGPVGTIASAGECEWKVDCVAGSVTACGGEAVAAADDIVQRLPATTADVPLWIRIANDAPTAAARVAARLHGRAALFVVDVVDDDTPESVSERVRAVLGVETDGAAPPVLIGMRADLAAEELAAAAIDAGAQGVFVRGEVRGAAAERVHGRPAQSTVRSRIRALRAALPASAVLVAGSVIEPEDARLLLDAGATWCAVDAGLVLSGPGLIKRCNETLLLGREERVAPEPLSLDAARRAWFWALMLGIAMSIGGMLALALASTRVVLPYDESLCGLSRAQLASVNPRLLPFMAHDRVNLAGSMLSLGVLYTALAWHGVRRGQHWAQVAIAISGVTGFFSFFLFLAFGYFDPFHAFVTATLFQFLLLGLITQPSPPVPIARAEWRETPAWRRAQWGQLLFIVMGIGLLGAGVLITLIGCSYVFIDTDLEFLRASAASLLVAHDRLVPLVAHDRASLGGMLMANGLAVWLSAQWGLRCGAVWLWRALAFGGQIGFACAIGVHFVVGYTSALHLAPAFAGWALWSLALALTREWTASEAALRVETPPASRAQDAPT